MNPYKWKWYTWATLVVVVWEAFMVAMLTPGYYPSLGAVPWFGLAFSTSMTWFTLALLHHAFGALLNVVEWLGGKLAKSKPPPPRDQW